jgi:hypothetical protein
MCPLKKNKNMNMRLKVLMIVFCVVGLNLYAQSSLNAHKYIIVPKKFDFLKGEDKYQLNSLTKFLFTKEGFVTLFDGDKMAQDLFDNPCLGLTANVKNQSKMFTTNVVIELSDCRNTVIYTSKEGRSKEKEYKKAYQGAIRRAFQSVKELEYSYNANLVEINKSNIPKKNTLEESKQEVIVIKETAPVSEEIKTVIDEEVVVEEVVDEDITALKNLDVIDGTESNPSNILEILYAQETTTGFQLVDRSPKVVYNIQKSSVIDVYILKNKNGIVYKKNDGWVVEYYDNDQLVQKGITIKF